MQHLQMLDKVFFKAPLNAPLSQQEREGKHEKPKNGELGIQKGI